MAYRLEADEPISEGIKRIILERLDRAINDLVDPSIDRDEGVHNSRKSFKRIRAALRLVRDEIGADIYKRENICIRDCSRLLAAARDSLVMVETLDALTDYYTQQLPPHAFAGVCEKLLDRYQIISQHVLYESKVIEQVAATLQEARERIIDLPIKCEDFSALNTGLQRVYRRGRRAMAKAYADPEAEAFHEWRKRVKYLWYHLDILEMLWPSLLDNLANELHQLSDYLGDDHDLAELRHILIENPRLFSDNRELLALVTLIDQRRSELEAAARPRGERIYFDKPQAFVNRITAYWEAWRDEENPAVMEKLKTDSLLSETAQLMVKGTFLSTKEVADFLGVVPERVRAFIRAGKLPATKVGQDWVVKANAGDWLNGEEMAADEQSITGSLLSTRQAAIRLDIFPGEVRALIKAGELPAFKVSRSWIIREDDLEQLNVRKAG